MEDLHPGDSLRVVVRAADPDGNYIRDGRAIASVQGPGSNALYQQPGVWDNKARGYIAYLDTTGWPPGDYVLTGFVTGLRGIRTVRGTSTPVEFTISPASDS